MDADIADEFSIFEEKRGNRSTNFLVLCRKTNIVVDLLKRNVDCFLDGSVMIIMRKLVKSFRLVVLQ